MPVQMLIRDPQDRWTAEALISHPYFADFQWEAILEEAFVCKSSRLELHQPFECLSGNFHSEMATTTAARGGAAEEPAFLELPQALACQRERHPDRQEDVPDARRRASERGVPARHQLWLRAPLELLRLRPTDGADERDKCVSRVSGR